MIALCVVCVFGVLTVIGLRNNIIRKDQAVQEAWAQVDVQFQRRADLIPNLVSTVKGYAKYEEQLFSSVTEARAKVGQVSFAGIENDPLKQKQLLEAQAGLTSALGKLIAVAENYPTLRASEQFSRLQDELAGTENRISVARRDTQRATRDYNNSVSTFPGNLFGFPKKEFYTAETASAAVVPTVQF